MASISILCHVDDYDQISQTCEKLEKIDIEKNLYFNLTSILNQNEINSIINAIKKLYPNAIFLINKDLGPTDGFFRLIEKWLEDSTPGDLLLKYYTNGDYSIFDNFEYILELFESHQYTGMVGTENNLLNISDNLNKFGLAKPSFYIKNSIFVVRSEIYKKFFLKFKIQEFLGRMDLPWEVLFGNIVTDQNYIIEPCDCVNGFLRIFDEYFYISNYFDVAKVVESKHLSSGFHHFIKYGINERRMPTFGTFDEEFYFSKHNDVKNAVQVHRVIRSGYDHFCGWGYKENREFAFK